MGIRYGILVSAPSTPGTMTMILHREVNERSSFDASGCRQRIHIHSRSFFDPL